MDLSLQRTQVLAIAHLWRTSEKSCRSWELGEAVAARTHSFFSPELDGSSSVSLPAMRNLFPVKGLVHSLNIICRLHKIIHLTINML